ncbi:7389_t:CDS:2, partial [Ambispora gerdemannii]
MPTFLRPAEYGFIFGHWPQPGKNSLSYGTKERRLRNRRNTFFSQSQEKNKKIARYHQYECAKETLRVIEKSSLKGGVNNHTTGSGKSDTMAFLAKQLRREHPQCSIIIITDRNELDRQIYERFREYEGSFFTLGDLVIINDISKLKNQLAKPNRGKIIFALIQKFQDLAELTEFHNSEGVFVFIDEAHRSQNLAADIENKKRKTDKEIGPIIHTYSVNQALENEIVVPITYEKAYEYLPKELQKDPNYQNKSCLVVSKQSHHHSSELISDVGNEKENIKKFKNPQSNINIVIVVDKLTTGFNMENLERIYLDQQIDASH